MKIQIEQRALNTALLIAKRVVPKRNRIPILANVKLTAANGALEIVATDLEIVASISIDCEIVEPGAATIPARACADLIKRMSGIITLSANDDGATLSCGASKMNIVTLPLEDYPDIGAKDAPLSSSFTLAAADLASALEKTRFAISEEETRYYLNGVFLHGLGDKLRFVASNGYILAQTEISVPLTNLDMRSIVPRACIDEMRKLLAKSRDEINIELFAPTADILGGSIRFRVGAVTLWSKLIYGTFPDYSRIVPSTFDKRLTVKTAALIYALKNVAPAFSARGAACVLTLNDIGARVAVNNPETGKAMADIVDPGLAYEGDEMEIAFNGRYLLDALSTATDAETRIAFNGPSSPARIECCGCGGAFSILMPQRI